MALLFVDFCGFNWFWAVSNRSDMDGQICSSISIFYFRRHSDATVWCGPATGDLFLSLQTVIVFLFPGDRHILTERGNKKLTLPIFCRKKIVAIIVVAGCSFEFFQFLSAHLYSIFTMCRVPNVFLGIQIQLCCIGTHKIAKFSTLLSSILCYYCY